MVAAVVLLLVAAAAMRLPTLGEPLLEAHAFRQTQTAYTAVLYWQDGVDLAHPRLPVLGEPFEVPFEFPLFQAMAAGLMSRGMSPDTALRSTALGCFLLSGLALWMLVRHVANRTAAFVALFVFLFTPFSLVWSKASLIEYLAVAGCLGWLLAGLMWREHRAWPAAIAAVLCGVVAMLVKPTTGAFWVLPLVAFVVPGEPRGWRAWLRARCDPVLVAIVVAPYLAAVAWTLHADNVKAASPATRFLTSASLVEWNYGTLGQRLDPSSWAAISDRVSSLTVLPGVLLPLAFVVAFRARAAAFWIAWIAVPFLTVLTFWNLYVVHDYYLAAITPIPAAVIGLAVSRLWDAAPATRSHALLLAVAATWFAGLHVLGRSYWLHAYRPVDQVKVLPALAEVDRYTRPGDLLAFEGDDWSPHLPYYARRRGFMIRTDPTPGERRVARTLSSDGYRFVTTPHLESEIALDFLRARSWTGVLGRRLYVTGERLSDLLGARLAATDSWPAEFPIATEDVLGEPVRVVCGGSGAALPPGRGTIVLRLAPDTSPEAKLALSPDLADVPARQFVVVEGRPDGVAPSIGCRDAVAVTVTAAYELPAGSARNRGPSPPQDPVPR